MKQNNYFIKLVILLWVWVWVSLFLVGCNSVGGSGQANSNPKSQTLGIFMQSKQIKLGSTTGVMIKIAQAESNTSYPVILSIKESADSNVSFSNGEKTMLTNLDSNKPQVTVNLIAKSSQGYFENSYIELEAKLKNSDFSTKIRILVVDTNKIAFSSSNVNLYSTESKTIELKFLANSSDTPESIVANLSIIGDANTLSIDKQQCSLDNLENKVCAITIKTTNSSLGKYYIKATSDNYESAVLEVLVTPINAFNYNVESVNGIINEKINFNLQFGAGEFLYQPFSIVFDDINNVLIEPKVCHFSVYNLSCEISVIGLFPGKYTLYARDLSQKFSITPLDININPVELRFTPSEFHRTSGRVDGVSQLVASNFKEPFNVSLSNGQTCYFDSLNSSCSVAISSDGGKICNPVVNKIQVVGSSIPDYLVVKNILTATSGQFCN